MAHWRRTRAYPPDASCTQSRTKIPSLTQGLVNLWLSIPMTGSRSLASFTLSNRIVLYRRAAFGAPSFRLFCLAGSRTGSPALHVGPYVRNQHIPGLGAVRMLDGAYRPEGLRRQ